MAIDATKKNTLSNTTTGPELGVTDIAAAILAPLASLRLTVCLLVLAVIVTFIATVDQTRNDILDVKHKHFQSVFVEVPFQTLFVQRWFPEYQNVPGSFYIPSGVTILVLMLINLTAAHMLRFRLQASGGRLAAGIIGALLAAGLTWTIIFNGQDASGFQNAPPISFDKMWIVLQLAVLAVACTAGFGFVTIDRTRKVERMLLAIAAVVCSGLLVISLLLGEKAFIGNSAMRILWQLSQATVAAVVSLVASMLLFKRKAGIVLLHLGVAGLMFNEIYVTTTNEETRMTIVEGETVSQAIDIRSTELAIINTSDPEFDDILVVPGSKLESGEQINDPQLPFDVKCVRYMSSSDIRQIRNPDSNLATQGIGKRFEAFELPITTGTDSEQTVDFASAYVELHELETGKSLGTHLVSQNIDLKRADEVSVDGKTYRIDLRFKTDYKPFELTLVDVQAEYYLATETPRWFSSDVILNDIENESSSDQRIWMNNPLRFSGNTFYQQSLGTLPSGQEYTILQVVKNKGWMIPYVCCMFTVVGLMFQFGGSLLSFLEKRQARAADEHSGKAATAMVASTSGSGSSNKQLKNKNRPLPDLSSQGDTSKNKWLVWLPAAVLVAIFGLYVVGEFVKSQVSVVEKDGMRLDLLGQIPITKDGRVQPLDSFARNTARQLSKYERIYDGQDVRQPAIRWLADTIFEADGYMDYRVFRIEDPTILSALDLPLTMPTAKRDKNRFRYTLKELLDAEPKLRDLLPDPEVSDPKHWSVFQKRLSQVSTKLQRVFGAKLTFGSPEPDADDNLMLRLEKAGKSITSSLIPLVVPTDDPEKPWKSFMVLQNETWLNELANQYDAKSTSALATKIIDFEVIPPLREELIKGRIIERMTTDPNILKMLNEGGTEADPRELASQLEQTWDQLPEELLKRFVETEGPFVDMMLVDQKPRYEKVMADQIAKINDGAGQIGNSSSPATELLMELRPAYLEGDAEKFNSTLVAYLETVRADPPTGMSSFKLSIEKTYNGFAPFYLAMVMYLIAFLVATLAWVGWAPAWNRAATGLLLMGLSIQIAGLVMRVVISGRPPVTNLYSSVLFVSAVFVIGFLIVERMTKLGIGNVMAGVGGFLALMWAWTMTIVDGDTFAVLVAVLDTQFWLSTHVVCISIGYSLTFMAGFMGLAYVVAALVTPAMTKKSRREFANVIYGVVCFGLLTSFFGTVLGGLWGDDSWGRFWGWDPKENGALMIVLWNAVVLHARWGGMVRERGLAALAIVGNLITLWSWKGVNAMGVGLHAYAGTEDETMQRILMLAGAHVLILCVALIPTKYWMSYAKQS